MDKHPDSITFAEFADDLGLDVEEGDRSIEIVTSGGKRLVISAQCDCEVQDPRLLFTRVFEGWTRDQATVMEAIGHGIYKRPKTDLFSDPDYDWATKARQLYDLAKQALRSGVDTTAVKNVIDTYENHEES